MALGCGAHGLESRLNPSLPCTLPRLPQAFRRCTVTRIQAFIGCDVGHLKVVGSLLIEGQMALAFGESSPQDLTHLVTFSNYPSPAFPQQLTIMPWGLLLSNSQEKGFERIVEEDYL